MPAGQPKPAFYIVVGAVVLVLIGIGIWRMDLFAPKAPKETGQVKIDPGKLWKTPQGEDFKVELVLIDNPVQMRDTYAAGDIHVGWGTLDMLPLFMPGLSKDSRTMPRVYQQIDWSNGGDGVVVRSSIKE